MFSCINILIIICYFLFIIKYTLCDCYESDIGDYCSTLSDLKTRKSTVEAVEVLGDMNKFELNSTYFSELINLKRLKITKSIGRILLGTFDNLHKLESLSLEGNYVYEVHNEFFQNIPIKKLSLKQNNIRYIKKRSFTNLSNLTLLDLSENLLTTVHFGVFNDLKINDLILARNKITFIQKNALDGLVDLIKLDVSENKLTKFISRDLLQPRVYNLLELNLYQNEIVDLDVSLFSKLKSLNTSRNHIKRLPNGAFADIVDLLELHLAANNIDTLQPELFPQEGIKIKHIDLTLNRLSYMDPEFLARLPRIRQMDICGNPWQCPCYGLVRRWFEENSISNECDEKFTKGIIPICIDTVNFDRDCRFDVNLYEDYKNYINASEIKLNKRGPYSYFIQISSV